MHGACAIKICGCTLYGSARCYKPSLHLLPQTSYELHEWQLAEINRLSIRRPTRVRGKCRQEKYLRRTEACRVSFHIRESAECGSSPSAFFFLGGACNLMFFWRHLWHPCKLSYGETNELGRKRDPCVPLHASLAGPLTGRTADASASWRGNRRGASECQPP